MKKTALACLVGVLSLGLAAATPLAAQDQGMDEGMEKSDLEARVAELEAKLAAEGKEEKAEKAASDWKFQWSNGFKLENPSSDVSLKFGGRVQNDWAWYSADDELEDAVGTFEDGSEFRRARLFFEGELYDRVEFKAQYDFASGEAEMKDLYLGAINLPGVGGVRVGHFNEPFSLEQQTSSKYITFLERSLPIEAYSPARNMGVMIHDEKERFTWAVGAFRDTDDFGKTVADDFNWTARVTGLPWTDEDGSHLLHLGLSYSDRQPTGDTLRLRARPESHLSPRIVDTGSFGSDGLTLIDAEAALVYGPFSAQSEYITASADGVGAGGASNSIDTDSFYVYGSWFLTGEHRPYDAGSFGRVKPKHAWKDGGHGAWEIALRYSTLDLTDGPIDGGEVNDVTFGLNWYPFPNVRWMANYVMADRSDVGNADSFQMRFQFDF